MANRSAALIPRVAGSVFIKGVLRLPDGRVSQFLVNPVTDERFELGEPLNSTSPREVAREFFKVWRERQCLYPKLIQYMDRLENMVEDHKSHALVAVQLSSTIDQAKSWGEMDTAEFLESWFEAEMDAFSSADFMKLLLGDLVQSRAMSGLVLLRKATARGIRIPRVAKNNLLFQMGNRYTPEVILSALQEIYPDESQRGPYTYYGLVRAYNKTGRSMDGVEFFLRQDRSAVNLAIFSSLLRELQDLEVADLIDKRRAELKLAPTDGYFQAMLSCITNTYHREYLEKLAARIQRDCANPSVMLLADVALAAQRALSHKTMEFTELAFTKLLMDGRKLERAFELEKLHAALKIFTTYAWKRPHAAPTVIVMDELIHLIEHAGYARINPYVRKEFDNLVRKVHRLPAYSERIGNATIMDPEGDDSSPANPARDGYSTSYLEM